MNTGKVRRVISLLLIACMMAAMGVHVTAAGQNQAEEPEKTEQSAPDVTADAETSVTDSKAAVPDTDAKTKHPIITEQNPETDATTGQNPGDTATGQNPETGTTTEQPDITEQNPETDTATGQNPETGTTTEQPDIPEQNPGTADTESDTAATIADPPTAAPDTPKAEAPAAANLVEAKVYLLYDNRVPSRINDPFDAAGFGPAGDNTPYITVTVDLNQVVKNGGVLQRKSGGDYYSIDSRGYVISGSRTDAMKAYWEKIIYPSIQEQDRTDLDTVFGGKNNFYGYVLKKENDGWHIDGLMTKETPVYVVELYDYTGGTNVGALFAISAGRDKVTYESFKKSLEGTLGGTDYSYTEQKTDRVELTYKKGGKSYRAVLSPKSDESSSSSYHMYPDRNGFAYNTITKDIYYLSRIKIEIQEVKEETVSLTITKQVKGDSANPQEHFAFTLTLTDKNGSPISGSYSVTYSGTEGGVSNHPGTVDFAGGAATIFLKHREQATIQSIPKGAAMTIKEASGVYRVSARRNKEALSYGDKGAVVNLTEKVQTAEFTNQLEQVPLTGIETDIFPFLLLLGGGTIGGIAVFLCRGRESRCWKRHGK